MAVPPSATVIVLLQMKTISSSRRPPGLVTPDSHVPFVLQSWRLVTEKKVRESQGRAHRGAVQAIQHLEAGLIHGVLGNDLWMPEH